jgi:hypothetical protein
MGFETVAVLIFARLMELSQLLLENAGLLFFYFLLLVLGLIGIITVVRRWAGQ